MNADLIPDIKERHLALNTALSFIVQAPAGSGKTSLLVQRYLKLLALVNTPEEIIAITFTRKAAFTMRTRIIEALKKSDNNISPPNQFTATTHKLAQEALKQNQIKKWQIIQNPNRLRIQTIDAFCHSLVNQAPILTKINSSFKTCKDQEAENYYNQAATEMLENLSDPQYANHIERLLLHLDNDWQRAKNLLVTMLKAREQWLPHIVGLKNVKELRSKMEIGLQNIATENIERCHTFFPPELEQKLIAILKSLKTCQENPPPFIQNIEFTATTIKKNLLSYQGIAQLLLTKEFTWRQKITKEQGLPAANTKLSKNDKNLVTTIKKDLQELLEKLISEENFRQSLENLLLSPPPNYDNQQWEMIEALLELLPLLAAQLKLIFNDNLAVDHAEISMAALSSLGNQDNPTDLALNLDYRIQHLLIDEFQDTSLSQYRLLEKLITTWQLHDGRTLFIVGDPMQSIYRFREAEVGLFLRVQQEGIGDLKLHPLTLTTNFRSTQNIVNWINANFAAIFPAAPDISFGAIPFMPAIAITDNPQTSVTINLLKNATQKLEAQEIITTLKNIQQQNPDDTIALLVKARTHLEKIIAALQQNNINYQAVELETLHDSITIRDLFSLTRALYDLTDRIAWLAILRAPWCGLPLSDLHQIANGKKVLIWENICNICDHQTPILSPEGKKRLARFKTALTPFLAQTTRTSWRDLVEQTWLNIGGPATLNKETELEHAVAYFELLENNSSEQLDIQLLQKKLDSLYTAPTPPAKIQIMTIHKAKGLEFDHVIIPGVNRSTRNDEHKLMLWFERPQLHQGSSLLLAPIGARGNKTDQIYNYLHLVEQKKEFYETGRLLYVAMTRAKKSIHISGCLKSYEQQTHDTPPLPSGSILEQLKPCFNKTWITLPNETPINNIAATIQKSPDIFYLSHDWQSPITIKTIPNDITPNWQLTNEQPTIIGTIIHQCLRQISETDLNNWTNDYITKQQPYWHKLLQQAGYLDLNAGLKLINIAIKSTIKDQRGKWILTAHEKAASEFAITTKINNKFVHYIIDRTFIDESGIRWIIDYKISQPTTKNINAFLQEEIIKYKPQLLQYAKAMRLLEPNHAIKLGLYYPLFGGWQELKD